MKMSTVLKSCETIFCCNRKSVICPIIDVISDDTFQYITGSDMTWGGFNWKLNFRWYPVPQREVDRRSGDRSIPTRSVLDTNNVVCYVGD